MQLFILQIVIIYTIENGADFYQNSAKRQSFNTFNFI